MTGCHGDVFVRTGAVDKRVHKAAADCNTGGASRSVHVIGCHGEVLFISVKMGVHVYVTSCHSNMLLVAVMLRGMVM